MKKLSITFFCAFAALFVSASDLTVKPVQDIIKVVNFDCSSTAYGYYTEPGGGLTNVSCTVTLADCSPGAAAAAAAHCRDQNVCARVRANHLTPASTLQCDEEMPAEN